MATANRPRRELLAEIENLRFRLEEAQAILRAIGSGEVDALVVPSPGGERVFTLQGAEQPYRIMVESMSEGAATMAADGTIFYGNGRLADMLQIPLERLIGTPFGSYVVPADQPLFAAWVETGAKASATGEIALLTGAGSSVPVLISCSPLAFPGDRWVCVVVTDITERKRLDLERQNLVTQLERRNAALERFTYTVSHDLKTPLVTILGFIGQLALDMENNEVDYIKTDFAFIQSAALKMNNLLEDLLLLSRAGRVISEPQPVDLPALVLQVAAQLTSQLNQVKLRIDMPADLPVVKGDALRLAEVFQNLIENAAKFSVGQPEPQIEVGGVAGDNEVRCFVRDNGIGIPVEYREKVFGLFEKLNASAEGTGVGLAIVRRVIEEHGGRVWVESAGAGGGCTFFFTLPVEAGSARASAATV